MIRKTTRKFSVKELNESDYWVIRLKDKPSFFLHVDEKDIYFFRKYLQGAAIYANKNVADKVCVIFNDFGIAIIENELIQLVCEPIPCRGLFLNG